LRDELDDFLERLDVEAVAVLLAEAELERVTPFGNEDDREEIEELGRGILVETGVLAT